VIAYAISLSTDSLCISWLVVFQGNLRLDHDAEKELQEIIVQEFFCLENVPNKGVAVTRR
jgi:hypothetical protein